MDRNCFSSITDTAIGTDQAVADILVAGHGELFSCIDSIGRTVIRKAPLIIINSERGNS